MGRRGAHRHACILGAGVVLDKSAVPLLALCVYLSCGLTRGVTANCASVPGTHAPTPLWCMPRWSLLFIFLNEIHFVMFLVNV